MLEVWRHGCEISGQVQCASLRNEGREYAMIYGYSNGKRYELIKHNGLTGYLYVEGWRSPVWCTFERIEAAHGIKEKNK
jgi:hypothetical protein